MENKNNDTYKKISSNIFFIGYMGTGKTSVCNYLCELLNTQCVDIDNVIVERELKSIQQIFLENGENYFRDLETNILIELQSKSNIIISCGGGIILREENINSMKKNGKVVLLTASPQTIYDRIENANDRPLLNNKMNIEYITEMIEKRKNKYLEAADIIINTDNKKICDIAEEIILQIV